MNIPAALRSQGSLDQVIDSVNNREDRYTDAYYGSTDVRDALSTIYYGKCCYCERKPESSLQVEHYRPKGKITGVNGPGYYWMGNEWTNLMLACGACNNKKRTRFPLSGNNHETDHPEDVAGNFDPTQTSTFSNHLAQEDPLIINPEIVDPSNYLTINELGHYEAIGFGNYGSRTIEDIGLNRDSYIFRRQAIIDSIVNEIIKKTCERYHPDDPISPTQYQRQLNDVFERIIGQTHHEAEYNMLGNCMITKFEELILDDIERVFRKEILKYFIEFLENI